MACLNFKSYGFIIALMTLLIGVDAYSASRAQFRFLSFVIRDRAPDVAEAKAFLAGETSIEEFVADWLASKDHEVRVLRYFNDMFGVSANHRPVDWAFVLKYNEDSGVYYRGDTSCGADAALDRGAWWLEVGATIKVCPNEVSEKLSAVTDGVYIPCTASQVWGDGCGCGANMIGCLPYDLDLVLNEQIQQEFSQRAVYGYKGGASWFTTFGGDYFYGTKLLYWKYLHANKMAMGGMTPSVAELKVLAELTPTEWTEKPYPTGAKRFGLVTSPGFLLQNNNFRTRVRALSEKLLCQPVSAALNTSGISVYLNPDLSAEDLAHSENEQCARCHFPMDNLGSMLFGWNTLGEWNPLARSLSQVGHAFGRDGEGPEFFLRSFVERGPGFQECMASSAWQDFSGSLWNDLTKTQQKALLTLAASGPKTLIQTLLKSTLLANLGIDNKAKESVSTVSWEKIAPIVQRSCAGASCHSSTSFNTSYVGSPGNLKNNGVTVLKRIRLLDGAVMPPSSSGYTLSSEEKDLIQGFLGLSEEAN